jgi:hypothetical protein
VSTSLKALSKAYDNAKHLQILPLPVDYAVLSKYSSALHKLESARDEGTTGISTARIDNLKELYWSLLSNLLPYEKLCLYHIGQQKLILDSLEQEKRSNQYLSRACSIIEACILTFWDKGDNPLANVLAEEIATSPVVGKKCIVLPDYRHLEETRALVSVSSDFSGCSVCLPNALRELHFYEAIYLVGPPRRFERDRYILTSPRAPSVFSLRFAWLKDFQDNQDAFLQNGKATERSISDHSRPTLSIVIDGTVEIPEVNWSEAERLSDIEIQNDLVKEQEDFVSAKLHALPNNRFVFLNAEKDATILSLDPDMLGSEDDDGAIYRVRVSFISPGDYIILRTEGGKDAIVEKANCILGKDAQRRRDTLRSWKSALRELLDSRGETVVVADIALHGAENPSKANLRNWASWETIKPRSLQDFTAIMKVLQRAHETANQWDNADRILSAHQQAGHLIRSALISAIDSADLNTLKEFGSQVFELEGSGSMTAYRVEEIDTKIKKIPISVMSRVMELPRV